MCLLTWTHVPTEYGLHQVYNCILQYCIGGLRVSNDALEYIGGPRTDADAAMDMEPLGEKCHISWSKSNRCIECLEFLDEVGFAREAGDSNSALSEEPTELRSCEFVVAAAGTTLSGSWCFRVGHVW